MASLEQLFRGDLKGPIYCFELDLSLYLWPPGSCVQRISVPLRIGSFNIVTTIVSIELQKIVNLFMKQKLFCVDWYSVWSSI